MTVVDEFAFLEEPEITADQEKENKPEKSNIERFNEFKADLLSKTGSTYQGVPSEKILECFSIENNDTLPYDHISFTFKLENMVDINDRYIKEFKVPDFVEEIQGNNADMDIGEYHRYQLLRNRLQLVVIPSSVKLLGSGTFLAASRLEKVVFTGLINDDEKAMEDWFSYGLDTKENQLEYIGTYAFYECKKLKSIDLAVCNNLSVLGSNVFLACDLTNIKISDIMVLECKKMILDEVLKSMEDDRIITINKDKYTKSDLSDFINNLTSTPQELYDF
jgi:hypothetical protein